MREGVREGGREGGSEGRREGVREPQETVEYVPVLVPVPVCVFAVNKDFTCSIRDEGLRLRGEGCLLFGDNLYPCCCQTALFDL